MRPVALIAVALAAAIAALSAGCALVTPEDGLTGESVAAPACRDSEERCEAASEPCPRNCALPERRSGLLVAPTTSHPLSLRAVEPF